MTGVQTCALPISDVDLMLTTPPIVVLPAEVAVIPAVERFALALIAVLIPVAIDTVVSPTNTV